MSALIAWTGDAMTYALAHVAAGVLRVDDDGTVWRLAISSQGHWKTLVTPRRAENVGNKGYLRVSLHVPSEGRAAQVMAHRLVYTAKVGPIPEGLEINHKNLIKNDNRPDNLEPVTGAGNFQHSYANGRTRPWSVVSARTEAKWRGRPLITAEQKAEAKRLRAAGSPLKSIAAHFGIAISHAHRITGETS